MYAFQYTSGCAGRPAPHAGTFATARLVGPFASRGLCLEGCGLSWSLDISLFSWVSGCRSLVPLTFRSSIALNVMAGLLLRDLWKLHGMRAPPTWNLCGWCRDLGTCPAFSSRPHSSIRRGPCHALRPPPSTGLVKRSRALSPIPKIKYSWTTSSRKIEVPAWLSKMMPCLALPCAHRHRFATSSASLEDRENPATARFVSTTTFSIGN